MWAFACVCFLDCWVGWGCLVLGLGVPIGPNSKLSKGFLQMEGVPGHPRAAIGLRPCLDKSSMLLPWFFYMTLLTFFFNFDQYYLINQLVK